jgi:two-component system, NtrC family, sensor kinase
VVDDTHDREPGCPEGLKAENLRLLDELETAYTQMAAMMEAAEEERQVTYHELQKRNKELLLRFGELGQAHLQLQEAQHLLLQAERMSAVGQMAATIVHEVNSPLTVIAAQLEFMLTHVEEKETRDGLNVALDAAWRLRDLVQSILGFACRRQLESSQSDLGERICKVMELFRPLTKQTDVVVELADKLPKVGADASQIEQVLTNFLMNALDVTDARKKESIHIRTGRSTPAALLSHWAEAGWATRLAREMERESEQCSMVYAEVHDTGQGISAALMGDIFEPFFTTKREGKGTGLGLAISRSIVADHDGNILVASKEGEGSSFYLLLPPAKG